MSKLFRLFYPTEYVSGVDQITPEWIAARGAKGVIFDIDNTVVAQDAPADEAAKAYFAALHRAGIKTFVVSNNGETRVKPFAAAVGCGYFCKARKPSRKGYLTAIRSMRLQHSEVIAVGDQFFTDIWGANRAGIRSVLVAPVDPGKDTAGVRLKRPFEKIIFRSWRKSEEKNS